MRTLKTSAALLHPTSGKYIHEGQNQSGISMGEDDEFGAQAAKTFAQR